MSESNVIPLPTSRLAPDEVIADLRDDASHIDALVCVVQWKDGSFSTRISTLTLADLSMAARILSLEVDKSIEDLTP